MKITFFVFQSLYSQCDETAFGSHYTTHYCVSWGQFMPLMFSRGCHKEVYYIATVLFVMYIKNLRLYVYNKLRLYADDVLLFTQKRTVFLCSEIWMLLVSGLSNGKCLSIHWSVNFYALQIKRILYFTPIILQILLLEKSLKPITLEY